MGLTIHWTLKTDATDPRLVRSRLEQLRQRALDLPFESVGELVHWSGAAADCDHHPRDFPHRWLLIQAGQYVDRGGCSLRVAPRRVIGFSTQPGPGSEPANFGLCLYPVHVLVEGEEAYVPGQGFIRQRKRISTGLAGWRWSSFCKTQYASRPDCGGLTNFLRCHLTVVALLDQAKALGLLDQVHDEGEYWEQRNAQTLADQIGVWNEMIAVFAATLQQSLSDRTAANPAATSARSSVPNV